MPQQIQFEGTTHEFPDDFTQGEIGKALNSMHPRQASPSALGRFNKASLEANPLAQPSWVNSGEKPPTAMEELKSFGRSLVPGPGNYGPGSPLNLVHAIPMVGPSLANIGNDISEGRIPEALGHATGFLQGVPETVSAPKPGPGPMAGPPPVVPEWAAPGAGKPGMSDVWRAVLGVASPRAGKVYDLAQALRKPSGGKPTPYPQMPEIQRVDLNRSLQPPPPRLADPSGPVPKPWENPQLPSVQQPWKQPPVMPGSGVEPDVVQSPAPVTPAPPRLSETSPPTPYTSRYPEAQPTFRQPPVSPGTGIEPDAVQTPAPVAPARPTLSLTPPPSPYASRFPEKIPPRAPKRMAAESPQPVVAKPPATEQPASAPSPESVNRDAMANDLADFLHMKGQGISHAEASKFGPDQWKIARTGVDSARGKPPSGNVPSAQTQSLALARLKSLEDTTRKAKEIKQSQSSLKGKSLDIAQQLATEMGSVPQFARGGVIAPKHGGSVEDRVRGSADVPLSGDGHIEAGNLGRLFSQKGFGQRGDTIQSGNLTRAKQTAAAIHKYSPGAKSLPPNGNLDTWALGALEGQPTEQVADIIKDLVEKHPDALPPRGGPGTLPPESFNTFKARFLRHLKQDMIDFLRNPNTRRVRVTHGRGVRLTRGWIAKGMPDDFSVDNSIMLRDDDKPGDVHRFAPGKKGKWQITEMDMNKVKHARNGIFEVRHAATPWNRQDPPKAIKPTPSQEVMANGLRPLQRLS